MGEKTSWTTVVKNEWYTVNINHYYGNKSVKLDFTQEKEKILKILSTEWITEEELKEYNNNLGDNPIETLINQAKELEKIKKLDFKKRIEEYKKSVNKLIKNWECINEEDYIKKFYWYPPTESIYSATEIILDSSWKILAIIQWFETVQESV